MAYELRISGWQKHQNQLDTRRDTSYKYQTSGLTTKDDEELRTSAVTLSQDAELVFSAKGSHNYEVKCNLLVSGITSGTGIQLAWSGTNTGNNMEGVWTDQISSGVSQYVSGGSETITFTGNSTIALLEFTGILHHGTKPVETDVGSVGLWWKPVTNSNPISILNRSDISFTLIR